MIKPFQRFLTEEFQAPAYSVFDTSKSLIFSGIGTLVQEIEETTTAWIKN